MLELAAESDASLTHLFGAEHVGAEVAGMALTGNLQGKVFVSAQADCQTQRINISLRHV